MVNKKFNFHGEEIIVLNVTVNSITIKHSSTGEKDIIDIEELIEQDSDAELYFLKGKTINPKKFIVGKDYRYSQIPEDDTEDYTVSNYGLEYLGQNAIHIRFHETETDVWFIWDGQANEGIFKCVYNK